MYALIELYLFFSAQLNTNIECVYFGKAILITHIMHVSSSRLWPMIAEALRMHFSQIENKT